VALSGKMAQNAFFCENELLSFSCTLLSLEHTNSIFFQNGQFLTENIINNFSMEENADENESI